MEVFNLNIRPGKACPVLHCSQFDKGRMFRANLFDGAEVFTLTGSETLSVIEKKADGNMVTIGVANTSDNYVVFGTTEQMTALAGCQLCELRIVDGEDLIGSLNFLLDCEESPDTGIESESAIHNLQEQIGEAVAEQYSGENVVFDNTPTAGHGVGFAVTSEGLKAAIPTELNDFDDVEIDDPAENQALVWNPTTQKWENGEVSTVGSIDDLDDVDTTGKGTGDSLRFDPDAGEEGEWVAQKTVIPLTEQEYEDLQEKQLCTFYLLDDGSPLDYTAKDILYEEGGTETVYDKLEGLAIKNVSQQNVSINANTIQSLQLAANDAKYRFIVGIYISEDAVLPMQFYFSSPTEIYLRLRNLTSVATTCNITVFYA